MKPFSNFSIKKKIIFIILSTTLIGIITIGTFTIPRNLRRIETNLAGNMSLNTRLIAENCITTLLFDDKKGATEILESLNTIPNILNAVLYLPNGQVFTYFAKGVNNPPVQEFINRKGVFYKNKFLCIAEPVRYKTELLGYINVRVSNYEFERQYKAYIFSVIFIIFASTGLAFLLAYWLQKAISQPIEKLTRFTEGISKTGNFSQRISKTYNDETGILYDRFNSFLERIEKHQEEQYNAEKELRIERENLEKRVKRRTEELEIAMRKAEESDKLKSSFLANISHEIRTPMNAIMGFSEFLKDESLTQKQKKQFIDIIHSSGNQLLSIINDIVEISKIETGQIQTNNENVNIMELLEEIYHELSIIPDKTKIIFSYRKPSLDQPLIVYSDKTKLNQIISNIVTNAFKFTEEGEVEMGFSFIGGEIRIYVKDTGIGIDPKYHKIIFERFRQVEDKNRKIRSGSGLGLAISKAYAEMLGGTIRVDSEVGKGSEFSFTIPYIPPVNTIAEEPENTMNAGHARFRQTVLVAEDNDINFEYLQILLSKSQVKIIRAGNGIEAVDLALNNDSVGLVLMDIKMPEMNGLDATRLIKNSKPGLPVIATTAYALPGDREKAFEAGCDAYLPKPLRKKELFEMMEGLMQNRLNYVT